MSEFALDGLKQVMAIKSRVVLPYLVPKVKFSTWWPHPPQPYSSSQSSCSLVPGPVGEPGSGAEEHMLSLGAGLLEQPSRSRLSVHS